MNHDLSNPARCVSVCTWACKALPQGHGGALEVLPLSCGNSQTGLLDQHRGAQEGGASLGLWGAGRGVQTACCPLALETRRAEFLGRKVTFQVQREIKSHGHLLSSTFGLKRTGVCCLKRTQ